MRSSPIYPVLLCSLYVPNQLPRNSLSSSAPFNGSSEFVVWLTLRDSSISSSVTALCHPNPMHSLNVWSSVHTIHCPYLSLSSPVVPCPPLCVGKYKYKNASDSSSSSSTWHDTMHPNHAVPFCDLLAEYSDALEWWRQLSSISLVIILLHKVVKNYH